MTADTSVLHPMIYPGRPTGLQRAMQTDHDISLAAGILMEQNQCSRLEAVAMLVNAAQRTNMALAEVAAHVAATGHLVLTPTPGNTDAGEPHADGVREPLRSQGPAFARADASYYLG
jgi:hypothetical protein